jgi:hypothetical protein
MEKYGKLTDQDFCEFRNKTYEKGVLTLKLTSWDEFREVTNKFDEKTDYVWRGQRCYCKEWKLKSSFDRKFSEFPNDNKRENKLQEILNKFKQRLKGLPNTKSNDFTDDEIWAIGQHYGLPTPLLDWTECPYISAYMAFFKKDTNEQTENRVIYALNRALKLHILKTKDSKSKQVLSRERFVEFPDLLDNLDEMQNERLQKQKGRFTKALNGDDIKLNVKRFLKKGKYNHEIFLTEILIPDVERDRCLEFLESEKGITHGTLFPDYAGVVEICKMELGID